MNAEGIIELFEPVGRVALRRMFGGRGVYMNGLIFALEAGSGLFLKVDDINRPAFESRGSRPFTFAKRDGEAVLTSYWSLPDSAFDDPDELRFLTAGSLEAAKRAEARKGGSAKAKRPSPRRRRVSF